MTGTELVILLVVLVLAVVAAGYFSGLETGSYWVRPLRLRLKLTSDDKRARVLDRLLSDRPGLICTTLMGTNLFIYLATASCTAVYVGLLPHHHWGIELASTLTMAPILFIFAEVLPKHLFQRHAETLVYALSGSLAFFRQMFAPMVWVLKHFSRSCMLLLRAERTASTTFYSRGRLRHVLDVSTKQGVLSEYQQTMIANIMRLRHATVEQVMVPIRDCRSVSLHANLRNLRELGKERFTRFPVYDGEATNVVGVINVLDILSPGESASDIASLMSLVVMFPCSFRVEPTLTRLRQARQHLGVVADEHGNAIGIITIKDLVEKIVGTPTHR